MSIESYQTEQLIAEREFVGDTLFAAVDRLVERRGEELEAAVESGRTLRCATGDDGDIDGVEITFSATYTPDEDGSGFEYEIVKSEHTTHDFSTITDEQKASVITLLESGEVECLPEQADGLLRLIQAYLGKGEVSGSIPQLPYRLEYRFICCAYQAGAHMLVERAVLTYLDSVLISQTSIGSVDVSEIEMDDDDNKDDDDTNLELTTIEQSELDFSTATLEDIAELHEMLAMLGLVDRKRA